MARLIDAEKLWLTTEYAEDGKVHKYYEQFEVDNAPTIEAEPVRHGKWIWDDEGYHCSECFFHAYGETLLCLDGTYKYCPHCGAKMDEVNDGTN